MIRSDEVTRRVLWSLPTGLYVLGSVGQPERGPWNLMTINLVTQVATEPRTVAFSVESGSVTEGLLEQSGDAALSLLARQDRALVRRFVKPATDVQVDLSTRSGEMSGVPVRLLSSAAPVLAAAPAWLALSVTSSTPLSSHTVYLAEVVDASATEDFAAGRASDRSFEILRMEDTKMSYGG